jgi:hypothetical protein
MFKIWGKSELMPKDVVLNYLRNIYGNFDAALLNQAEKAGGVTIGQTKVLYLR